MSETNYELMSTDELLALKKKYESESVQWGSKEQAVKILLNSLYGALGNKHFRWFKKDYAEAITLSGQALWKYAEANINIYLNKLLKTEGVDFAVAGDTDSVYIDFTRLVDKFASDRDNDGQIDFLTKAVDGKIQEFIDRTCNDFADHINSFENHFSMKRENIGPAIFFKKKRYAMKVYDSEGIRYAKPKPKIIGHEAKRSTTPLWCRDEMKNVFDRIFSDSPAEVAKYMEDVKRRYMELDISVIALNTSVNNLSDYEQGNGYKKGAPWHVKAAIMYNNYIKRHKLDDIYPMIKSGDKVKLVAMYEPNPVGAEYLAFPDEYPKDFNLDQYLDKEAQYNKTFFDAMKRVFDLIGWKPDTRVSLRNFA